MATIKYYYKHRETTQIYYFIILQFRSLTMRLTSRFSSAASLVDFSGGNSCPHSFGLLVGILEAVGLWSLFPGCLSDSVWLQFLSLDLLSPVSKQQSWTKSPYSQNHLWPSGGGMNGVTGREGGLKRESIYIIMTDMHFCTAENNTTL